MNDIDTQRTYDSKCDADRVAQSLLSRGQPPEGWDPLLQGATDPAPRGGLSVTVQEAVLAALQQGVGNAGAAGDRATQALLPHQRLHCPC